MRPTCSKALEDVLALYGLRHFRTFSINNNTQAAQQHHAPSMMYLGKMFLYGQGFPVDYDMALLWFEKAAEEVNCVLFPLENFLHACSHCICVSPSKQTNSGQSPLKVIRELEARSGEPCCISGLRENLIIGDRCDATI